MRSKTQLYVTLLLALSPLLSAAQTMYPQLGASGVLSLAYSPDGAYLATGDAAGATQVWEVKSGKELRAFFGCAKSPRINAVTFNPTGDLLAAGCADGSITLWDWKRSKITRALTGDDRSVEALSFSPDGSLLFAGGDAEIQLWEVSSGKKRGSLPGHGTTTTSLGVSADGRLLFSGGVQVIKDTINFDLLREGTLKLWDLSTSTELLSLSAHAAWLNAVSLSPDGTLLASGSNDGTVKLWSTSDGKEVYSLPADEDKVLSVSFSLDGKMLASGGGDGVVKLWSVGTGKLLQRLEAKTWRGELRELVFSADGKRLAVGSQSGFTLWSIPGGKEQLAISARVTSVSAMAYSPDGKVLSSGGGEGIKQWEVAGKLRATLSGADPYERVSSLAYSADGALLAAGYTNGNAVLWDNASGKALRTFSGHTRGHPVRSISFSPDGKVLATGSVDKSIKLWEVESAKELASYVGHNGWITGLAFSPDGSLLASSSGDGIRLWDLVHGKGELNHFATKSGFIKALAFSPDGLLLASGSWSEALTLWRVEDGTALRSFVGHEDDIYSVSFSPDGETLASSAKDGTVRLWEVASGKALRALLMPSSWASTVLFSPDGAYLAAGGGGVMRVWRVLTDDAMMMVSSGAEWLIYTDDGLFDASPGGAELVAMVDGVHGYNIDQLAIKNNRPDLILTRMNLGSKALRDYYYQRYLKRLQKANLKEEQLEGSFQRLPESRIGAVKQLSTEEAELSLELSGAEGLRSYQVYVNGAPLYEGLGRSASGRALSLTETITLTEGENRVEVSALSLSGQESLRALVILDGPASDTRRLYFVGFGVSEYQDAKIPDLAYPDKDAQEMAAAFASLRGYEEVITKTYTNEEVTRESLLEAKDFFRQARAQDTVVLFIAGHGLHDTDKLATYYYIMHNTQLKRLSKTAASFEEVEGLLAGIKARQKVFLMDTCESGEREASLETAAFSDAESRGLAARAIGQGLLPGKRRGLFARWFGKDDSARGITVGKVTEKKKTKRRRQRAEPPTPRPWLLERDRYIYQDISRRTGAWVFSSSQGGEYSYENKALENGLFTEALLQGLSKKAADKDNNNVISLDELKGYVSQEVAALSKGLQHPTVDRDNLSLRLTFLP